MPMIPLYTKFRDVAFKEMLTILVHGYQSLADGPYGFLELYCNEAGCDCRRVIIQVIRPEGHGRVLATINFGFEKPLYYRRWSPRDPHAEEMAGAILDPLNPQGEHADALFGLFQEALSSDPAYVQRLRRHYDMFKSSITTRTKPRGATRERRRVTPSGSHGA